MCNTKDHALSELPDVCNVLQLCRARGGLLVSYRILLDQRLGGIVRGVENERWEWRPLVETRDSSGGAERGRKRKQKLRTKIEASLTMGKE